MKFELGAYIMMEMVIGVLVTTASLKGSDGARTVVRSINVRLDGGGDFMSIQKAVDSIPDGNNRWIRIHVGAGVYKEKVSIPPYKSFILLEGEGSNQTSIEWADHAGGRFDTAGSPTFASYANSFMARDITFKNTYDVSKKMAPAVAALVAGDRSSFYRCRFLGVQDTLCDFVGRHYYENCYIEGVVDFIFGNGQSIFQVCTVSTGKAPVAHGYITAQGRNNVTETSGFVFRGGAVQGVTPAYLGRAWRGYARVIFYQTTMAGMVVARGWDAWSSKGRERRLTMVESDCTGPGSNRSGRVSWAKKMSGRQIAKLVDLSYINGDGWLDAQPQ